MCTLPPFTGGAASYLVSPNTQCEGKLGGGLEVQSELPVRMGRLLFTACTSQHG